MIMKFVFANRSCTVHGEISNGHSYRHINYTRSIIITVNVCRLLKENPSPPSISARNFNTFTNLKHRIFLLSWTHKTNYSTLRLYFELTLIKCLYPNTNNGDFFSHIHVCLEMPKYKVFLPNDIYKGRVKRYDSF